MKALKFSEHYLFSQLPYGTMQDNEMRSLRVHDLQDEGFIFLWVTGRFAKLTPLLFSYI